MKKTAEIIIDNTLSSFEQFIDGPWADRLCWIVIGAAVCYFLPVVIATFII